MKYFGRILCVLMVLVFTGQAMAVDKDIQGRIGTAYATDPEKFGLDIAFQYNWVLDPYFVIGPEVDFFWIKWDRKIGREQTAPSVYADVKQDTNAYTIPFFLDAQLRLPIFKKEIFVEPYITVGLGWAISILHYSQPEFYDPIEGKNYEDEEITKFFHGFAWQVLGGISFNPSGSSISLLLEGGYRGAKLEHDDTEIDFSGLIIRAGVQYPL